MANLPADFSYSEDHEWINSSADAATGNTVRIGITSVAADRLGEVVFAELLKQLVTPSPLATPVARSSPPSLSLTSTPQ